MAGPLSLMGVYTKRCNARWSEAQQWEAPHVYSLGGFSAAASGGQASAFRKSALKMLREGRFAIQVLLGEDYVSMTSGRGTPLSLWSADPWALGSMVLPAKVREHHREEGTTSDFLFHTLY